MNKRAMKEFLRLSKDLSNLEAFVWSVLGDDKYNQLMAKAGIEGSLSFVKDVVSFAYFDTCWDEMEAYFGKDDEMGKPSGYCNGAFIPTKIDLLLQTLDKRSLRKTLVELQYHFEELTTRRYRWESYEGPKNFKSGKSVYNVGA